MRHMFNSIGRSSNFAQAGKSAADETVRAFAASRRNAPKYGELAQKAQRLRSEEKIAAMKAEQQVAKAGIVAQTNVKTNQIKLDAESELKSAKRKAGALAAGGKLIAQAGNFMDEPRKKREVGSEDAWYDEQIKAQQTNYQQYVDILNGNKTEGATPKVQNEPLPQTAPKTTVPNTGGTGSSSTSKTSGPTSSRKTNGGSTAMRLMTDLTNDGYTPIQAAGIVGNAQYESANFTAHEEFAPNAYGTKGAGFFQWTNAGGSNRRDSFEAHARGKGLDPRSYEANTSYMMHEMKGGAGNHWTGGMNDASYRQIGDLSTAVTSFQNNYLRPAKATANTQQRMNNAQSIYDQWMARNS